MRGLVLVPALSPGLPTLHYLELHDSDGGRVVLYARARDAFSRAVVDAVVKCAGRAPGQVTPMALAAVRAPGAPQVRVFARSLGVTVLGTVATLALVWLYIVALTFAQG